MSNIVILMGSVRKGGNTDLLVQAFAEGAEKNNTVEIISAADSKVNPCIGCNTCFEREGNRCFQEDDMQEIYDLLQQSDDAHTEETQELIAVCNKINQNVEMGTTSVCSLLGLLIGILLAKTFAIFMKGV